MCEKKKCSLCEIPKPLTEFHKDKYAKTGYKSHCKSCFKEHYQDKKIQHVYYQKWYAKVCAERLEKNKSENVCVV